MADNVKSLTNFDSALSCSEYKRSFTWPKSINTIAQAISLSNNNNQKSPIDSNNSRFQTDSKIKEKCLNHGIKLNNLKTEYRKKFQPFSKYIYITGLGWQKHKNVNKLNQKFEKKFEWYNEVKERNKKATEFRNRLQLGHPITSVDHLEEIYKLSCEPSCYQIKDRSIAALALATSQLKFQDSLKDQKFINPKHQITSPQQKNHLNIKNSRFKSFNTNRSNYQYSNLEKNENHVIISEPGKLWVKDDLSKKKIQFFHFDQQSNLNENNCIDTILNGPVKTTSIKSPLERAKIRICSPNKWTLEMDNKKELKWINNKELEKTLDNNNLNQSAKIHKDLFTISNNQMMLKFY